MYIKKGCRVKRAELAHGMNYYVVFAWARWWVFGECGARPCKNSLNYWLFCTTNGGGSGGGGGGARYPARRPRRQRIHCRNARHTFRDCSGCAEAG